MNFEFISRKLKDTREGMDRNYLEGRPDIHESSLELQKSVEKEYLKLVQESPDFFLIDCCTKTGETLPPEAIHQKITALLREKKIL
jgi:dTMP kinase